MPPSNLINILSTGLKDARNALGQISRNNPLRVTPYVAYYLKGFGSGSMAMTVSDPSGKVQQGFVDDFLAWFPDSLRWEPKTNYILKTNAMEKSFTGVEMLKANKRNQHRCYTRPLPVKESPSENVKAAIGNFLKTVTESPGEQQSLTSRPDGKNAFRLKDAGFGADGHFWFIPENDFDVQHPMVYLAFNVYEVQKQQEAAENWKHRTPEYAKPLSPFFEDTEHTRSALLKARPLATETDLKWQILTNSERAGAAEQRTFVRKALATPDIALLEGPPGSGKTTVILELILQLVKQGKRVLLSSATHVAIDNVLERLVALQEIDPATKIPKNELSTEILAVRIASNPNVITSEPVKQLHEEALTEKMRKDLEVHYASLPHKTAGQQLLLNADEKLDKQEFAYFLLNHANVVAGTLVGLLQHKGLKDRQPDFEPFDCLIVDEASKVTLSGFLVPAQWASRWILVGDTHQLAPFTEKAVLETILMGKHDLAPYLAEEVISKLSDAYDYRQHPTESEKRSDELEETWNKVSKVNLMGNAVRNHEKVDLLKELGQLFLPSVFELFQRGLPEWLQTNSQQFTLHAGLEQMDGEGTMWQNRFQALRYQHRMVDELARIPRKHIYNDQNMHSDPNAIGPDSRLLHLLGPDDKKAAVWIPVSSNGDNKQGNPEEAEKVMLVLEEINLSLRKSMPGERIKVLLITFYKAQQKRLSKLIDPKRSSFPSLYIDLKTVDSVQGQEAEIVLLCFSKWSGRAFYQVPNRLNVAITRARQRMFLFGNPKVIGAQTQHPALFALCTETKYLHH